jgi:hypothetical protein
MGYTSLLHKEGPDRLVLEEGASIDLPNSQIIVVGPDGSDTTGTGSWMSPVATLTKALSLATAVRPTIFMLPGEYEEAAMITWPNVSGLSIVGMGGVSISNGNAAAAVIDINPTYTASTFEISLTGITIDAVTQIGIRVDNAHMGKKMMLYLDRMAIEDDTPNGSSPGDSLVTANTVTGQAIRIYARDCSFEKLVHLITANAGARFRFQGCDFLAGVTTGGAVAAEYTFLGCISNAAVTHGSETANFANKGCIYRTDADPAIYSDWADVPATG